MRRDERDREDDGVADRVDAGDDVVDHGGLDVLPEIGNNSYEIKSLAGFSFLAGTSGRWFESLSLKWKLSWQNRAELVTHSKGRAC